MGALSKIKKAVTKVAKAVTKPVKQATKAVTNVVKSVSKPVVKAVSSVATGVKKVATNVVRGVAKAPARVLGSAASGIKKVATSTLKSVGKVALKVAVTAAKVSSKLGVAGHIIDVALVAYTGGAYAAAKLAAKKVITHLAASAVAKKLAPKSKLAASVASALISGGSTKSLALKQAALSATQRYAINKAGQQLAKKSNTLASALNIYNGVSSVAALGRQVSSVSSGARQLGKYMAPASRALPAPNQKPTGQTFPLAAKGGATNIRALPSAAGSYTIKKGDSLWTISSRTGVPVADLMKANGISNPNLIRTGAKLSLPVTYTAGNSRNLSAQNAAYINGRSSGSGPSSLAGSSSSIVNRADRTGDFFWKDGKLTIVVTGKRNGDANSYQSGAPVYMPMKTNGIGTQNLIQTGTESYSPMANAPQGGINGNSSFDLFGAAADTVWGTGVTLMKTMTGTYVYRPSPYGGIGPDAKMRALTDRLGLRTKFDHTPVKGASIFNSNYNNGMLGNEELAAKKTSFFRKPNTEVVYLNGKPWGKGNSPAGSTRVDVQSRNFGKDIFESKVVKELSYSKGQAQANAYADIISKANGFPSKWSYPAKWAGRALGVVGVAMEGWRVIDAGQTYGWDNPQTKRTGAQVGGALSGGGAGAVIGSILIPVPLLGTLVGGIAGSYIGDWLGGVTYDSLSPSAEAIPTRPAPNLLLAASRTTPVSIGWIDNKGMTPATGTGSSLSRRSAPTTGRLASFGR
ncbi:MAG: LysM peptidoglycan-binding domain-containing protein [Gammaproteobacteria bacterium]|nr:LysM peptidoglycan-binding domain-containing protein [Gammaproteobacteria bacterium]MBU1960996.1 LysM peptidoglycan-binding domain-containing protein [Gammaproteobacteria bacterium]